MSSKSPTINTTSESSLSTSGILQALAGIEFGPEQFLESVIDRGVINLSQFSPIKGGGTHKIYRSKDHPEYLLKIIKGSLGQNREQQQAHIDMLREQYSILYDTFGEERCLLEQRTIQKILDPQASEPQVLIVSVVPFDECFQSEEKFGLNLSAVEADDDIIINNIDTYISVSKALMISKEPALSTNFLKIHPELADIYEKLETDVDLQRVMSEFLSNYKRFHERTGIFLDLLGKDNVLFYKVKDKWQYKVGSVIKHDNTELFQEYLQKAKTNPGCTEEFKGYTSLLFMPSNIRTVNQLGLTLGLGTIINGVAIDESDIFTLSILHNHLPPLSKAQNYLFKGKVAKALEVFDKRQQDEISGQTPHDTEIRDVLAYTYLELVKEGKIELEQTHAEKFLAMLKHESNEFPDGRKEIVSSSIQQLEELVCETSLTVNPFDISKGPTPATDAWEG